MAAVEPLAIGVDVGATKIAAALVSRRGEVLAANRYPTNRQQGTAVVMDTIAALVNELLAQGDTAVTGIGIGSPGWVDPEAGIVREAVNLNWLDVPLAAHIQSRIECDLPVYVHRDAYAEVLGEAYFGAGQGCANFVYLGIGSGLGGGVIVNGQLVTGADNHASEIGHLSLDTDGRLCNCGLHGCAETVVSGTGVMNQARELLDSGAYPATLLDAADLSSQQIIVAAEKGDGLATAVIQKTAGWLGQIIAMYAIILNPRRIVIGGGFGKEAFNLLLPGVREVLRRRVLRSNQESLEIVPSKLASSAVGATCLVWYTPSQAIIYNHLNEGGDAKATQYLHQVNV
ncbi:MAG: ROK family protein [Chloroflexi bacterium]|nr:ROK family protein [Chloroflexota bacterium]